MKGFGFNKVDFTAEKKGSVYSFSARYKGRLLVYETTDKTLYEDVDSNDRRSKAARSFVYEKMKDIYYCGVNSDIIVGGHYRCMEDVVMEDGEVAYVKGKVYRSDQSGCITDESGCINHMWLGENFKDFLEYVQD